MAKPIKETPILKGKDAKRFNEQHGRRKDKISVREEAKRIQHNYNLFKAAEKSDGHLTTANR